MAPRFRMVIRRARFANEMNLFRISKDENHAFASQSIFSKRVERRRINRRTDHDARLAVGVQDVGAQQTSNSSAQKIKPPPLPNGSAHVNVKAGMSDEDWEKAYKETGRPKFSKVRQ